MRWIREGGGTDDERGTGRDGEQVGAHHLHLWSDCAWGGSGLKHLATSGQLGEILGQCGEGNATCSQ